MDLALHARVLRRHRVLVTVGLLAATALALLSYVRVGSDGVHYRSGEQWQSVTRLFAAQQGVALTPTGSPSVDPTGFAIIAAQFANSDAVLRMLRSNRGLTRDGKLIGTVDAGPLRDSDNQPLPFIEIAGTAPSPSAARSLARHAAAAMSAYVQQRQADVPKRQRITLQVVSRPSVPELAAGRSKGPTMFIFLAIASLTVGAAYVRENLRGGPAVEPAAARPPQTTDAAAEPPHMAAALDDAPTALPLARKESGVLRRQERGPSRQTLSLGPVVGNETAGPDARDLPRADEA